MAASALARSTVESLLRERRLDRTLTTSAPLVSREIATMPSGVPSLDVRLGGGWPKGQWSEVVGPRSSGRSWTLAQAMAQATQRGELVALIDAFDTWDPTAVAACAPEWGRWLWVRGLSMAAGGPASAAGEKTLATQAVDRALKAAAMLLQAGGFAMVGLDLSEAPQAVIRALPFTTWLRLQRMLEGHDTVGVLLAAEPTARSAEGVSVQLHAAEACWSGSDDRSRYLAGCDVRGRVAHARRALRSDDGFTLTTPMRRAG